MAVYKTIQSKQIIMGKLSHGSDLLGELTDICHKEKIVLGTVTAIGAVQKACIGYYDQARYQYRFSEIDKHLEIASLSGNISLRDGKPMVHAHVILSDDQCVCFAGHLAAGTIVFACEFTITACEGPAFLREHDDPTGLPLWKL